MRYRLWSCLFAVGLAFAAGDASAGRFGGGKNIGSAPSSSSSYSAPSRSYSSPSSSRSYSSPSRSSSSFARSPSTTPAAAMSGTTSSRFGGSKNSGIQRSYNSTPSSATSQSAHNSPSASGNGSPTQGRLLSPTPTPAPTPPRTQPQPVYARPASPSAIPGYAPPRPVARPVAVAQQSSSWWRPATAFLAGLGLGALFGHHQDSVAAVSQAGGSAGGAGFGAAPTTSATAADMAALGGTPLAAAGETAASGGEFWHTFALFGLWATILFLSYKVLRLIFYRPAPIRAAQPHMAAATAQPHRQTAPNAADAAFAAPATGPMPGRIPDGFPKDEFERAVEASFIRLQAANDRGDLDDIREYTTPEIFAEVSLQLQERGNVQQHTDVLRVGATLLDVLTEGSFLIASVMLQGSLRENNGPETDFREIWHIRQDQRSPDAPWLLAGIQQV